MTNGSVIRNTRKAPSYCLVPCCYTAQQLIIRTRSYIPRSYNSTQNAPKISYFSQQEQKVNSNYHGYRRSYTPSFEPPPAPIPGRITPPAQILHFNHIRRLHTFPMQFFGVLRTRSYNSGCHACVRCKALPKD